MSRYFTSCFRVAALAVATSTFFHTTGYSQNIAADPFAEIGDLEGDPEAADTPPGRVENPEKEDGSTTGEGEPRPIKAQISAHIVKLADEERKKRLTFMRIVIDDVVRLCDLDEEQEDRLFLAARGAAERSMKEWHEQAERYFRNRLEQAEVDDAKEMLDGMGNVNFGGNHAEEEGESLDLWRDSLKVVLTEEQIQRYESIVEERRQERIQAFSQMSLTTIDQHLRFTPEQKSAMQKLVLGAATEYLDDVQRYWGDYFERGMLMSLANAAEPEELKEFLTENQFERLREATSNFDHFWDQKRKMKRAKRKAAVRRSEKK